MNLAANREPLAVIGNGWMQLPLWPSVDVLLALSSVYAHFPFHK